MQLSSVATCLVPVCIAAYALTHASSALAQTASIPAQRCDALLAAADTGHDGKLSQTEIKAFLTQHADDLRRAFADMGVKIAEGDSSLEGYVEKRSYAVYNAADRDKSGLVERAECEKVIQAQLEPFELTVGNFVANLPDISKSDPTILERIDRWVSVRRSFLDANDVGRPATLTFSYLGDEDDTIKKGDDHFVYEIRGAVALEPQLWDPIDLDSRTLMIDPVVVFEADAVSNKSRDETKIIHRAGFQTALVTNAITDGLSSHLVNLTLDYTTDREYAADTLGGTLQYTINLRRVGIGEYKPLPWGAPVQMRWRPYLELVYGNVLDAAGNPKLLKMNDYTDVVGRLAMEFLMLERLRFVPEARLAQGLSGQNGLHPFFSLALRYSLDDKDRVSVELSYEQGEDAPKFIDQQVARMAFGLKF